jgi:outer membrane protein assembly factor BamB
MKIVRLLPLLAAIVGTAAAGDWPGYRGPNHNGISDEKLPASAFPAGGPAEIWKAKTNTGFGSFAVANGKALTLVNREVDGNPMEVCVAFDASTGKELWQADLWLGGDYGNGGGNAGTKDNSGGDGPRSTPAISDGKAYVIDAHLRIYCFDLESGDKVWSRDLMKDNSGVNIKWMNAAAPLIDGPLVFVAGGGKGQALMALEKNSGEVVWAVEDDIMTHATPIVGEVLGQRQVIFFTQSGLVALEPANGSVLWRYAFPYKVSTAASPVIWEDIVYCSAGYGVGAGAVRIEKDGSGFKATEIWRSENENMNHWSTPVVLDGYLYGMFGFKKYGEGPLACVDIRTGEEKWSEAGFGPGGVLLAGQQLLALSDTGEIAIVEAKPDAFKELARTKLISGKVWSSPALANGKVFIRSTVEGGSFDLTAK